MMTVTTKNDLDNAKIYKIVDNTNSNVYIGSTCRTLKARLANHKYDYQRFLKGVYYNTRSFEIIKNNDYAIELLEDCQVKTKSELFARERYFIENTECVNKYIPGRTYEEYYIDNKESKKAYYINNKERIKEYTKVHYIANKEKIKEYTKARYIANKEKIKEQQKQKIECDCGGKYTNANKTCHIKTAKHQKYLETLK